VAYIPAARIRTGSLTKQWFYEPFLFCAKKEKSFPVITGKLIKDNRKMSWPPDEEPSSHPAPSTTFRLQPV
jgi:hypothetical protein